MSNLVKYQPAVPSLFSHRDEFVTSFDRLFNQLFEEVFPQSTKELGVDLFSKGAYPKVNVLDEEKQYVLEAELPGISKDQVVVDINHVEKTVTIKGEKRTDEKKENKGTYLYRELKQSSFVRSFQFGDNSDLENVNGKFENGVLILTIPKKEPTLQETKVKRLKIE